MITFYRRPVAWKSPTACYPTLMGNTDRGRSSDDVQAWALSPTRRERALQYARHAFVFVGIALALIGLVTAYLN